MRLLLLHSDYIYYSAKKEALSIRDEKKEEKIEDCVVVFTAVEKGDDKETVKYAISEIIEYLESVKSHKVVLYPYVHLTSSPASPQQALELLKQLEHNLSNLGYEVYRAPFGWYKEFNIKVKGHPLAELSREIKEETKLKTREEIVEKIESHFVILKPDGEEINIGDSLSAEKLEEMKDEINDLALYKYLKNEFGLLKTKQEPPSIDFMRKLEIADYEKASDPGNFRYYPKGVLLMKLFESLVEYKTKDLGIISIETPIMYDFNEEDIRKQVESFHERHYKVITPNNKEYILRFAGDFGLFRMLKEANISYKQLPLRVYELSKSFRFEKRGELKGLSRLRAFHMPDIHCFVRDEKEGWKEYSMLYKLYDDYVKDSGIEYSIVFRITRDFYKKYKDKLLELIKYSNKPALIEILSEMKHYWAVKHEIQGIDAVGGNVQLSTVQFDIKDASIYGIYYINEKGERKAPIIIHSSLGSLERWMYITLEEALKKDKPEFPFWLAPTQIRIIPIKKEFLREAEELREQLNGLRVDIDDREESLSWRIRMAELEWIPYIIVLGEKEIKDRVYSVRKRDGSIIKMSLDDLKKLKDKNIVFADLVWPYLLSKRPVFVSAYERRKK